MKSFLLKFYLFLRDRFVFSTLLKSLNHKGTHVLSIYYYKNVTNRDYLLLPSHQTRFSSSEVLLTNGFVIRGFRFSLYNTFRILSQTFSSLSCSRFDTTGVSDPESGPIYFEIVHLGPFVLSFLLVSFSSAFTWLLDVLW